MIQIEAKSIPHNEQRYETVGDWYYSNGVRTFRVSEFGNKDYEFMILLHEMVEQHLCEKRGISQESVDAFDIQFEKDRQEGNEDEPGDEQSAPYYREHQFATIIERMMCQELGIDWKEYEKSVFAF